MPPQVDRSPRTCAAAPPGLEAGAEPYPGPETEPHVNGACDERDLIAAAAGGDHEAFAVLVQRHQQAALRVALALTADPGLAEDAVQEAFLAAYADLRRFDPVRPFRPWLLGIVVHRAQVAWRGRQRRLRREWALDPRRWFSRPILPPPALPGSRTSEPDLLEGVLRDEAARALWDGIGRLAPKLRQVVVLHYFGGLPIDAVAAALGCPSGTIKSRLYHGRKALAALLADADAMTDTADAAARPDARGRRLGR